MPTKRNIFVGHARKVKGMKFQETAYNVSRNTPENVPVLRVKCPELSTDRNQNYIPSSACLQVRGTKSQQNPSNSSRETAEKCILFSK